MAKKVSKKRLRKADPFGRILLLDLYGCRPGICDDLKNSEEFLETLVRAINMHKQCDAYVVRTDHRQFPDKKGVSGWIALVESGIQIHTLSSANFVTIDVYSCNRFGKMKVMEVIRKFFKPKKIEIATKADKNGFILRGLNYHKYSR